MAAIDPSGNVYVQDGSGTWFHVPDVDTANALGIDWNNLDSVDGPPDPYGGDWPSVDSSQPPQDSGSPPPPPSFDWSQYVGSDVIDPSGAVYRYDANAGNWKHIPDPATANAMGVNWNALTSVPGQPQPFGGDWPSYVPPPPPPVAAVPTPTPTTTQPAELVSEHGAGQGTPVAGAVNVNEQAAALGLPPLVPIAAAPENPQVIQQEAAAYTIVQEWQGEDIEPGDDSRTLQSAESQLRTILPSSNLFGYDLPDSLGGNQTAKTAWRSLMSTFANDVVPALRTATTTHNKLRQRIGS